MDQAQTQTQTQTWAQSPGRRRCLRRRNTASVLQSGTDPDSEKKYFGMMPSSPYDKEIANIAIPALLTLTLDPLVSLVDTALVGRLGAQSLGGM